MFFSIDDINSSSVECLSFNTHTNQVMVNYVDSDDIYLYTGVSAAALYQLVFGKVKSIRKWVNRNLKVDTVKYVTV